MHALWHEVRQALGQLRHSPGFSILATVILGLGLAVTLYMFTVVKAYMLTPLPYPESERIVHLERANRLQGFDGMEVTQHDFVDWREAQTSIESLAAYYSGTVNVADGELPERYEGAFITPDAFDVIQVQALHGRVLRPEDARPGAAPVIVIGYDMWLNRYNGDRSIVGRTIRVNGQETTVAGVMPKGFRFPTTHEVWLPLKIDLSAFARGDGTSLEVFGRLKDGVTLEQARAEFSNIAAGLAAEFKENENITAVVQPFTHEFVAPQARVIISTMFAAVLLVLLIACANVANLILARTAARQKDIALRAALGASRWRILVHVLTESVVLAALGAIIAYFLADLGLEMTRRAFAAADIQEPFWITFDIDARVLAFAALAAVTAGILAGLAPALRATRTDINEHLKEGSKGSGVSSSRLSRALVTAEIALSCVLLVSSGLLIRSVVNINDQPLGIETTELLTGRIGLPEAQYPDDASRMRFFDELVRRLEADPDVLGATAGYSYPGIGSWNLPYRTRGMEPPADGRLPQTRYAGVMNNYADVLGIRLLHGRWFDARDRADSEPVAVIDRRFASEAFGGENPVGQQILIVDRPVLPGNPGAQGGRWHTIVGVSNEVLLDELDDPVRPTVFVPLAQNPQRFLTVAVHTRGAPLAFAQTLRETVQSLDRDIPVYWMRTLDDWIWAGNFTSRIVSTLFGIFAILAVILAAAGIYGVLAYSVSQRTREIGVRRALGARDKRILHMVLGQGLVQLAIGLGVGLVLAVGFAQLLASMLQDVSPFDPVTLASVSATLFVVAVFASLLPALRAMRVNPMQALRYE